MGELFFAYDDDGRDEGFLAEGGPGVRRIGGGAALLVGLVTRFAVASGKNRSMLCRGWRDEWRELEFGVCNAFEISPSTDAIASPSGATSISSARDVGGDTNVAVGLDTDKELASFDSTESVWKTGGEAYSFCSM